jgi:hypothetical protein
MTWASGGRSGGDAPSLERGRRKREGVDRVIGFVSQKNSGIVD